MATVDVQEFNSLSPPISGMRRWLALCVIVLAAFMTTLDDFIVFVAEPALQQDLRMTHAGIQWVITGYVLAYGVTVVSGGRLGDIYGHKRVFLLGLWGFILASILCGIAPNAPFLIGARILEGLTAAIMFPQVFALIKFLFPPREQGLAFGILGAVIGAAAIGGQLVGGLLLGANLWGLSWRPIFFINVPVGVLAALLAPFLLVKTRSTTATRVDMPGMALAAGTLLLLCFPLVQGREMGWPLWSLFCLVAFFPSLWLFMRYERYRAQSVGSPLLELKLFRNSLFVRGISILLLETALGSGLFFILALFLQSGHQFTAFEAGLAFTPMAITYTIGSLLTGMLTSRLGTRVIQVGIVIAALGTVGTYLVVKSAGDVLSVFSLLPLAIMGFGNALVATPLPGFIVATAGDNAAGAAAGAISTAQQLGPALGIALVGIIFFGVLNSEVTSADYTEAFTVALLSVTLGICVLQMLLTFGLSRSIPRESLGGN